MILSWLRNDRLLALVLTLLLVLADRTAPIQALERMAYDIGMGLTARPLDERITLIAIDDASIARLGPWPWSKHPYARLLDILALSSPKAIGFTFPFLPSPPNPGLEVLNKIKNHLNQGDNPTSNPSQGLDLPTLHRLLDEGMLTLNEDRLLAEAIQKTGNVILTMPVEPGVSANIPNWQPPPFLLASALTPNKTRLEHDALPISIRSAGIPMEELGIHAAGIGVDLLPYDRDGILRSIPLVVSFHEMLYPSMALALATRSLNLSREKVQLHSDGTLHLGLLPLRTHENWQLRAYFHGGTDHITPFTTHSFHAILDGKVPPEQLHNQIVLVGVTATAYANTLATPVAKPMTPLEIQACTVTSILKLTHFSIPDWAWIVRLVAYLASAFLLIAALPKPGSLILPIVTTGLFGLLLPMGHYWFMTNHALWVPLMGPWVVLVIGYPLLIIKRWRLDGPLWLVANPAAAENNRMLGLALQGQKKLNQAFGKFMQCPMDPTLMEILYYLALDFEAAHRFHEAERVYRHMWIYNPSFKDLEQRLHQVALMADEDSLAESTPGDERAWHLKYQDQIPKRVGAYLVTGEFSRDALGHFLMGRHPKSQQQVVLRTLFSGPLRTPEVEERARQQLFHDAGILIPLKHPGIVTVLDVGLEDDLPFVVMEPWKLQDSMEHRTHPDTLLPLPLLLHAATQAAMILDEVHRQGITHGNLSPENLIYDAIKRQIKIKEFGIARFLGADASGTGISAYAPPEALAGQSTDPRSDLYALGAIIYHLLTGQPPFIADDPEQLRSMILHTTIPPLVTHPDLTPILDKAMQKLPKNRYQRGFAMARDLIRFVKNQVRKNEHSA
ncbi:MAG: serine/threonine-protein kinase [Magnetococcus sp. YQC-5]